MDANKEAVVEQAAAPAAPAAPAQKPFRPGKKRKKVVDAVAATLILEGYLTFCQR